MFHKVLLYFFLLLAGLWKGFFSTVQMCPWTWASNTHPTAKAFQHLSQCATDTPIEGGKECHSTLKVHLTKTSSEFSLWFLNQHFPMSFLGLSFSNDNVEIIYLNNSTKNQSSKSPLPILNKLNLLSIQPVRTEKYRKYIYNI